MNLLGKLAQPPLGATHRDEADSSLASVKPQIFSTFGIKSGFSFTEFSKTKPTDVSIHVSSKGHSVDIWNWLGNFRPGSREYFLQSLAGVSEQGPEVGDQLWLCWMVDQAWRRE